MTVDTVNSVAVGHLNQLLHLSLLLSSRGLAVHYAAPPPHVRQARERLHGWDPKALVSVEFHDLDVSSYDSPAPDPAAPSPFPNHLMPMFETFAAAARAPLASPPRTPLRHLPPRRRRAGRLANAEAFGLQCVAMSYNVGWLDPGHRLSATTASSSSLPDACMSKEFDEQGAPIAGVVMNTCRVLEGEFIDVVARAAAVQRTDALRGLLDTMHGNGTTAAASVLYVSFGTTSCLRAEQVAELAAALKGSRQRFIWVLRDADRADIFAESGESRHAKFLSEFTKETEGTGLLEILAHGATAAFMSHCGWNSTIESLSHGKPVLAWPMHSDQPWDSELLCKYLKAGLLVRPWEKHGETISAEAIQKVIEEAMVSDNGMAVRKRGRGAWGGTPSRKDLDDFVAYITR
ncbi:hypothetical protein HU200_011979 [Digitaria exilis]|uniref:Glycosyltransferase N-terminal domain-containing protein n=1 Tax=Digitaria exilis TaxID=1010633 RepID=A0A835KM84_9POAL|nr:hypothetical protein HU200_011979 [Digitaria exilis]